MWRGAAQVKVWLQGGEKAHYYVLSRFLVSRALTVTRIPHMKAVKIALELKKFCVDNDLLDISQVCRSSGPSRALIPGAFEWDFALPSRGQAVFSGSAVIHRGVLQYTV